MTTVIILAGLGLLFLPGLIRVRLARLEPVEWCRSASWSVKYGLATVQLGLLAGAAPTLLRALNFHGAADACHRLFGPAAPGGAVTGWLSALALTWVISARRRARRNVRRTIETTTIEDWLGTHETQGGIDHVTIPAARPLAYAVPGPQPQIVVSTRLRESLTDGELRAVLRHEASHLRRHHHRHLVLAHELETVFPGLSHARNTSSLLRLAIERVADEDAINVDDDRTFLQSALYKTAASYATAVPTFTPAETIIDRISALAEPGSATIAARASALAPITVGAATAFLATSGWVLGAHRLLLALATACLD